MDQFDRDLKRRAREEPFPLPDSFVQRLRETCDSLEEPPRRKPERRQLSHWGAWFAAVAASLLVVLPNVSASAAEVLEQIPVLGSLVQVVTLRNYLYDDGHSFADVSVPQVLEGGQAGSSVNAAVQADIDRLLDQFQQDAEVLAQGGYQSLDVSYEVTADTDRWFTLCVSALQTQASGYQILRYYHIDKSTGEMATLSDLFPSGSDYVSVLSDEVRRQMEEGDRSYFSHEFRSIDPEQPSTGRRTEDWCWSLTRPPWPPPRKACWNFPSPPPLWRRSEPSTPDLRSSEKSGGRPLTKGPPAVIVTLHHFLYVNCQIPAADRASAAAFITNQGGRAVSWDYFTHARTLELLYHKLQSPVLARYQMTQIELDVLLFLANHPGLDTAKDIVEIRRLTKSHVSAAVEGLSRKGYLLRVRRPDNRKLIHLTLLPEAAPVVADGQANQRAFFQTLEQGLSPQERAQLDALLRRVTENVRQEYLRLERED